MKQSIHYANIGIAVGAAVTVAGVFVLRGLGEGALQFVGLAALFSALAVYLALQERARRGRGKRPQ
jgi:predicted MFS family arabinose efflux permease